MSCPQPSSLSSAIAQRLEQLDALLAAHDWLWRPQPYKLEQPDWFVTQPQLVYDLLQLDDAEVDRLMADASALVAFIARAVPSVVPLAMLIVLPEAPRHALVPADAHALRDIPGRKAGQIEHFAAALGTPAAPLVEWCAGKGHLGRRLACATAVSVTSIEIDARLCEAGRTLAQRAHADSQRFVALDVLGPFPRGQLRARHAIALHACGDLHAALLHRATEEGACAVHLVPCCYHKTADASRASLSGAGSLQLTQDELRLAVSDAVIAAPREIRAGRRHAAWTLGFRALTGVAHLPHGRSRDATYRQFCEQAAARAGLALDGAIDWSRAESDALQLEHRVRRLALPRQAFRRALELWLAFDRARFLEQRGYRVSVSAFCAPALTPRNILIAAER